MSTTARHYMRFLLTAAVATTVASSAFYDALNDEQKARLVAIDFSRKSLSKFDQGERRKANGRVPDDGFDCRPGSRLSSMGRDPQELARFRQVERAISLSDEQHANLYDLTAADLSRYRRG